jgi:fructuronate reductase
MSRVALTRPESAIAPVRHVHLGLGAFFRAHQADYTQRCGAGEQWGIAAFAGRTDWLADRLTEQRGLYTLVVREDIDDRREVIHSVSRSHRASDTSAWQTYFADPQVSVLTLTVTEAAYPLALDGGLDLLRADVRSDIAALRQDGEHAAVVTMPGRLVRGLIARKGADAGPITFAPCDNLPNNGLILNRIVTGFAAAVDARLADWVEQSVQTVSSLVDRITPATTAADVERVSAQSPYLDACPVITEPYREWVLSGFFAGPRPPWERAGALFTDDLAPYERRKLWLLNGAHSLLAYTGPLRGHHTVVAAMRDPTVAEWVEQWWDEAGPYLPFSAADLASYRGGLVDRFANPRIEHRLAQIASDGSVKLPARILPVLTRERKQGRMPPSAARALAAWVLHLRGYGAPVQDLKANDLVQRVATPPLFEATRITLTALDPQLGDDGELLATVTDFARELQATADRR